MSGPHKLGEEHTLFTLRVCHQFSSQKMIGIGNMYVDYNRMQAVILK